MVLETEIEFYNDQKEELLKHYKGQFALIKSKELIGTYTTWEEAFNDAVEKFGNSLFLIKPVQEEEEFVQFPALLVGAISANA
jgi:hypothetical protein